MAADKHAPDSLKYQWRLVGLVQRAKWATSLDKSVAYEIVDNYYSKFGNARASLSYLQKATGAKRSSVIASTRRIVDSGIMSVVRQGVGTRPTEYRLHFELAAENLSSPPDGTTSNDASSSPLGGTSGSPPDGTISQPSSPTDGTQTVLPVSAYEAGLRDRMINDRAPPSAPPASAADAPSGAVRGREGFDKLWSAYGHRQRRAEARAAYDKLSPDADLHAEMVEAAQTWRERWEAQGTVDAPRKTLAGWIAKEHYLEDPPQGYRPKAPKTVKPAPTVIEATKPMLASGAPRPGRCTVEVVDANVARRGGVATLMLTFAESTGEGEAPGHEWERCLVIEHPNTERQESGLRELEKLKSALGLGDLEDSDDLLFKPMMMTVSPTGRIDYGPIPPIAPLAIPVDLEKPLLRI